LQLVSQSVLSQKKTPWVFWWVFLGGGCPPPLGRWSWFDPLLQRERFWGFFFFFFGGGVFLGAQTTPHPPPTPPPPPPLKHLLVFFSIEGETVFPQLTENWSTWAGPFFVARYLRFFPWTTSLFLRAEGPAPPWVPLPSNSGM